MLRRRTNKSPGNLIVRWPIADSAMLGGQTPGHRPWSTSPNKCAICLRGDRDESLLPSHARQGSRRYQTPFPVRCCPVVSEFLLAQRYASRGTSCSPVSVCDSVSVTSRRSNWSSWFLHGGLLTTCATLRFKEIQVSAKIRVLRSETLSQIPDFEISPRHISIVKTCYQLTI